MSQIKELLECIQTECIWSEVGTGLSTPGSICTQTPKGSIEQLDGEWTPFQLSDGRSCDYPEMFVSDSGELATLKGYLFQPEQSTPTALVSILKDCATGMIAQAVEELHDAVVSECPHSKVVAA